MTEQDMNQCMGCQGGWPMEGNLFHREPGTLSRAGLVACTASKYPTTLRGSGMAQLYTPGGDTISVPEEVVQMAELAYQDHGKAKAHGVLRELYPDLTLLQSVAVVNEAVCRVQRVKAETLTDELIRQELETAMQKRATKAGRKQADRDITICRQALGGNPSARQQVANRINSRRGVYR